MLNSDTMWAIKEELSWNDIDEKYILEKFDITHEEFMIYQAVLLAKGEI